MSKRRNRRDETPGADASSDGVPTSESSDAPAIDGETFRRFVDTWLDPAYDRITLRGVSNDDAGAVLTRTFREVRAKLPDESAPVGAVVAKAAEGQAGGERTPPRSLSPAETRRAIDRLTKTTDARRAADDEGVATLLWQAAGVFGPRDIEILDLHWRYKLDATGVAAVVGGTPQEIEATIEKLPNGFATALRTRVLWGDGRPQDPELAAELQKHSVTTFDAQAVRIVHRHLRDSPTARARSLIPVPAIDAFAAIPIASAPTTVRKEVVVATTVDTGTAAAGRSAAAGRAAAAAGAVGAAGLAAKVAAADPEPTLKAPAPVEPQPSAPSEPIEAPDAESSPSVDDTAAPEVTEERTPDKATTSAAAPAAAAAVAAAAGSSGGGPVHTPVGSTRDGNGSGGSSGASKRWLGVGIAAAVVLIAIIAFAATRSSDDGKVDTAGGDVSTTTTRPPTTSASTTTTTTGESTTTIEATTTSVGVTTTTAPITTTTTVPRTASITSFVLNPATPVESGYTMGAVTLSWSVSGSPDQVEVSGPGLLSNETSGGPTAVCPGTVSAGKCQVQAGTYQYVINVTLNGLPVAGSPRFAYVVIRD